MQVLKRTASADSTPEAADRELAHRFLQREGTMPLRALLAGGARLGTSREKGRSAQSHLNASLKITRELSDPRDRCATHPPATQGREAGREAGRGGTAASGDLKGKSIWLLLRANQFGFHQPLARSHGLGLRTRHTDLPATRERP